MIGLSLPFSTFPSHFLLCCFVSGEWKDTSSIVKVLSTWTSNGGEPCQDTPRLSSLAPSSCYHSVVWGPIFPTSLIGFDPCAAWHKRSWSTRYIRMCPCEFPHSDMPIASCLKDIYSFQRHAQQGSGLWGVNKLYCAQSKEKINDLKQKLISCQITAKWGTSVHLFKNLFFNNVFHPTSATRPPPCPLHLTNQGGLI